MTVLLDRAIRKVQDLPASDQDRIALEILGSLTEPGGDDRDLGVTTELASLVEEAVEDHRTGRTTPLSDIV